MTPLTLFNSLFALGRDLRADRSLERARLFPAGPTVYNYAHIGNLRAYVFTDTLSRVTDGRAGR